MEASRRSERGYSRNWWELGGNMSMTATDMTATETTTTDLRVSASNLTGFVCRAFVAAGLPKADA
jgi:hypothetical protein